MAHSLALLLPWHVRTQRFSDVMLGVVLFAVLWDWIVIWSFAFSYEYWLPLRPLILVLMNRSVRHTFITFLQTAFKSIPVPN